MKDIKALENEIERLLPEYTDFLSKLVKKESTYGREEEAQLYIKSKMESFGLQAKALYSRQDKQSVNLVAVMRGKKPEGHRSLILNAHCDVAPIDCANRWSHEPFSGDVKDGVLYGRGSQDDKAGITILLLVANAFINSDTRVCGDIIIESVIEDETTGNGTKTLVENGYTADGVIICDGTWSERIVYAHLGQVWIDADIKGEPVAACVQHRGVNPVYIGIELIEKLKKYVSALNAKCAPFCGIDNPCFLNVGSFDSGAWHGSVPVNARLQIQVGFAGEYSPDEIIGEITKIASEVSPRISIRNVLLKTEACKRNKNNQLIVALKSIVEKKLGKDVSLTPVTGHSDLRHFPTENICLYGPGGGKNAHGVDECYYLGELPKVAKNIARFAFEWCNQKVENNP